MMNLSNPRPQRLFQLLSRASGSPSRRAKHRRRRLFSTESLESRQVMTGDVTGSVFFDANANGVDDPTENGLPGWTVFADTNNDGTLNAGEPSTVTDDRGRFALLGLPAVATTVYEVMQPGYVPTPGFTDHQAVTVREGREVRIKFPNTTAAAPTGQINGTVFEDLNENLSKDPGEHGLTGWTLFLDRNGDGALTAGEPTATSDVDGDYVFADVTPGPATVYEIPQGGYGPVGTGLFPLSTGTDHRTVTVTAGSSVRSDFANNLPPVGTIQGTVWNDANGDGIHGATEGALAGRTVFVDLNSNGAIDAGEPSRVTDSLGAYSFANIHTGFYRIQNDLPAGWISADTRSNVLTANVFRGGLVTADFFNLQPTTGSISGALWNDADGNGVKGATESPLTGWQVFLDLNSNGTLDAAEPNQLTSDTGAYTFTGVAYGNVTLREVVPSDWVATNPASASTLIHLLNGETRTNVNLGSRERIGSIQGTVWNDANGDKLRNATESGLADWTVYLDLDGDNVLDAGEPSSQSGATGSYTFTRVPVGTYRVAEVIPAGWITSEGKPSAVTSNVTIGSTQVADFYNLTPVASTLSGIVFSDVDSNGTQGIGEPGLADWQVYVDMNANGALDAGEPQTTTDAAGSFSLTDVAYGTHTIREVVQAGFTATNHPGGLLTTFVLNGETRSGLTFGNHETAEFAIRGTVYHDANHDGVRDATEHGLSGVTVYLDTNNNGVLDATEPTSVSSIDLFYTPAVDETGTYSFTRLLRGNYTVREVVPATQEATPVAAREKSITVGPLDQLNVDFANQFRANEIHGVVFDDTDADHQRDANEYARPGIPVYIDLDRDDVYDVDEPHTVTADDGSYAFTGLTPGAYIVREDGGGAGPHTYPQTTGGTLWPAGTSHPSIGNVSPGSITASLANGETLRQTVSLTLPGSGGLTNLVDVFLLFDDTGSFTANSPIVREAFPTIMSTLQGALPGIDLGFGVGRFEEYGSFASEFATGRPFTLNQPIVAASTPGYAASIQAGLDRVAPGYGGDGPETDIEGLYQLVTGRGFDGNNNGSVLDSGAAGLAATQLTPGNSGDVPGFDSFTADPANNVLPAAGNVGGAGFRAGSLPIVLLATDTGFAYQPKGETSIVGTGGLTLPLSSLTDASRPSTPFGAGAGIQETVTGLNALGALVIGLGTNPETTLAPRQSLEALANLTGAVNRSTTTVNNGTPDAIAPGDPFYFQISSGFGTTVADGVVNAIQNAVTNVAMDITVRASDPRVHITNFTGTLTGVSAGQTATFDIEFVGDSRPHRFDLEFVRAGTSVVLGSIPVVLGTPVVGDGYSYDELGDGEIHQSSHFGNYIANEAPSFVVGVDVTAPEDGGVQSIANWATNISPGPAIESLQTVDFVITSDNPSLFSAGPSVAADGTLTFTPALNANGSALITIAAHDNGGVGLSGVDTSAPQTFRITITPTNDAPIAADDAYEVANNGTPLVVTTPGILANDIDGDGDPITATLVSSPTNGTLTLLADGSFEYAPVAGFSGTDSFSYTATDGTLVSNVATVNLNVTKANRAPLAVDDHLVTDEDTTLSNVVGNALANDTDGDGDVLSGRIVVGPAHGSLNLNVDGTISYVPTANFHGTDSFTYVANDGLVDSNVATVTIDVASVNDAPVAVNDTYSTAEDTTLNGLVPGVLLNDTDVDGDSLSVTKVSDPAHGVVTLNADGSFSYIPAANFFGSDSFTYQVFDGTVNSSVATVSLNVTAVNDAPITADDNYAVNEDTSLTVALPGVMGNDSDVEGSPLSATRVTAPAHGTVTLNANGSFTYTPALNYNGPDSFTYRVSDGLLTSNVSTVTIQVAAVNDAPVAVNNSYSTNQDVALNVPAAGVLANDTDVDSVSLTSLLGTGPAHGTVTLNANGSFNYVPAAGYSGADSFTYRASDGVATSGLATVSITVVPFVPATKFFVVDTDRAATFQYTATGGSITNTALNRSDSKPRGIASSADGSTQWVIDGSGTVFVYNSNGTLAGQWTPQNVGKPEGITVWGNDLWVVDPNQDRVFLFSGGATLRTGRVNPTSSFALNAGNLNSTDLASDGAHLWVLNDTLTADKVFRYTTAGVLEGSWSLSTTNPTPTGITLDPTNVQHLWVVDASTDRIYQYDGATSRLTGSQEPSTTFALAATNTNAQGIADPMPAGVRDDSVADKAAAIHGSPQHHAVDHVMEKLEHGARPARRHDDSPRVRVEDRRAEATTTTRVTTAAIDDLFEHLGQEEDHDMQW